MMNACACIGNHYYGESECPCRMESMGLPRSRKWHDEHTPEYLAEQHKRLHAAFSVLFKDQQSPKQGEQNEQD